MKQEYKGKLELCKKLLHESLYVESDEIGNKMFDDGYNLMKDLIKTKNIEVLYELFDLFTEENENGVCETLESDIFQYFSWDQIFSVLKGKLDKLIELNSMRAEHFVCSCDIGGVKELMSTLQLSKAMEFLSELQNNCRPDLSNQIGILLEDMKKW